MFHLADVELLAVRAHVLHLLADVVQQRRVLVLDRLGDCRQFLLHLFEVDQRQLVAVLDVPLDCLVAEQLEVAAEHLQILVRQNLVEEQVARVVHVQLDLQAESVRVLQRRVEQADQHRQVVSELGVQLLLLAHFLVIEHVTLVPVDEKVVAQTEKFDSHNAWSLLGALSNGRD